MASDKLFEALDVVLDVGLFPDVDEDPCPFDGFQAVHHHEKCVWVPVSLVLLDQCLGLGVDGEYGLVFLVADAAVDVASGGEVSVL